MVILMSIMPETPYYLIQKGKESKANKSLQWLRGKNTKVDQEMELISKSVEEQSQIKTVSIKDLLSKPVYYKPFLIMLALHFIQQNLNKNLVLHLLCFITNLLEKI